EGLEEDWAPTYIRHTAWLEEHAGLNREQEAIPAETEIRDRMREGKGFVTPELAVLASYTKIQLMHDLLNSPLVDDEWFHNWLYAYFPQTLRKQAGDTILHHPLAKQIIAMTVANHVVNTGGISSVFRAQAETAAEPRAVVESVLAAQDISGPEEYRQARGTLRRSRDPQLRRQAAYGLRRLTGRLTRCLIDRQGDELNLHQRPDAYE